MSTLSNEIGEMIKSQVDASNDDLYAQLQNERHKNKRMRKELDLLMKNVYKKSSSNNERPSQEDNQAYEDESDDDFDDVNESDSNPNKVDETDSDPDGW
ncbi:putative gibberellin 2-beta-dioxygenase 2-like [Capsicum annuum]|nr:putative gibberellin 2-beta-dioxygenase 2-like [Capsicum annuum]KAF3669656.1 putative gibberellin 2-beta-dioxygenase 2-like [Capsicum annuum]